MKKIFLKMQFKIYLKQKNNKCNKWINKLFKAKQKKNKLFFQDKVFNFKMKCLMKNCFKMDHF